MGATVVTFDVVESGLAYLVRRGKITADEAREAAKKVMEESRREGERSGGELGSRLSGVLKNAHFVTQDEFRSLEERVRLLEQRAPAQEHVVRHD